MAEFKTKCITEHAILYLSYYYIGFRINAYICRVADKLANILSFKALRLFSQTYVTCDTAMDGSEN